MHLICQLNKCTGCGMCTNICPKSAIVMKEGKNGFFYPNIEDEKCVDCGLCKDRCPSNNPKKTETNVIKTYAAWNKKATVRKKSSSGGVFSVLAEKIISGGGVVAGVAWNNHFLPEHILVDNIDDLNKLQGSKYSQSNTNDIYNQIKETLKLEKKVLFSGTPCQVAALKAFLGKDYFNLLTVDLVCHGVPSNKMLLDYYRHFNKNITDVRLRYKNPYWDYSYVRIDFSDREYYQELTINDDYYNLFNIGFSLRESCHDCLYASTHRQADITLADYWGYSAHSFKTKSFNKGTSLILANNKKGEDFINSIKDKLFIEESNLEKAKQGNKCLNESFQIDSKKLTGFWNDYNNGLSIHELNEKYCAHSFKLPKFLWLKRFYRKYRWIFRR